MAISQPTDPNRARRPVTSVSRYEDATHAVDWLSDHDFPVERVSIVGTGLRYVEAGGHPGRGSSRSSAPAATVRSWSAESSRLVLIEVRSRATTGLTCNAQADRRADSRTV
jgi:hypothetical protein